MLTRYIYYLINLHIYDLLPILQRAKLRSRVIGDVPYITQLKVTELGPKSMLLTSALQCLVVLGFSPPRSYRSRSLGEP